MSRALHDVANGTLLGVALNFQGLLKQHLAEFEQPPYQKVHLDLDVLDPSLFRALLFANPETPGVWDQTPQGSMTINQVVRLLADIAEVADVVGLGIAEHLPWDALALKNMLTKLPLIGSGKRV